MKTAPKDLKPGDRVSLPAITLAHVIVIGPEWNPNEVWLTDTAGHVHVIDPLEHVLVEAHAS